MLPHDYRRYYLHISDKPAKLTVLLLTETVNIHTPWEQKLTLNDMKMIDMWISDYVNLTVRALFLDATACWHPCLCRFVMG